MIKLSQRGRPTLEARKLLERMNDYLQGMSAEDKTKFSNRHYEDVPSLESAWAEMQDVEKEHVTNHSQTNGNSNESSPQPKVTDSVEEAHVESVTNNDFIEEEEDFVAPEDGFEYDPNIGDTKQREYNKETYTDVVHETIGEPIYSTETISTEQNQSQSSQQNPQPQNQGQAQNNNQSQSQQPPKEKPEPVNPKVSELSEKDRLLAAENTVDLFLSVYDKAHEWVRPLAKIKDKKINALERTGLISPTDTIHVGNGNHLTAREIIADTNKGIEEVLTPDPTFNASVRPFLVREFSKRGLALTDLQQIAIKFGMDIAGKAAGLIEVRKNLNDILNSFKEMRQEKIAEMKRAQNPQQAPLNVDSISSSKSQNRDDIVDDHSAFERIEEANEVH